MSSDSCVVRLLNERNANVSLLTAGSDGTVIATAAALGASPYASVECGGVSLIVRGGGADSRVSLPRAATRATLLALPADAPTSAPAAAFAFADLPASDDAPWTIDAASVRVINARPQPVAVAGVVDECWHCALPPLFGGAPLARGAAAVLSVDTAYGFDMALNGTRVPSLPRLDEHGSYTLLLRTSGGTELLLDAPGRNAYVPLAVAAGVGVALVLVRRALAIGAARFAAFRARAAITAGDDAAAAALAKLPAARRPVTPLSFFALDSAAAAAAARVVEGEMAVDIVLRGGGSKEQLLLDSVSAPLLTEAGSLQAPATPLQTKGAAIKAPRVLAIDTFRGIALMVMILANYGGGRFSFLAHSKWNGLTVADLVFPWFIWLSGVSYAISSAAERKRGASARALVTRAAVRSFKLIILGLLVNNPTYIRGARIPSVLGYFSFSGFAIAVVDACVPLLAEGNVSSSRSVRSTISTAAWLDYGRAVLQWAAMGVLWAIYLAVQTWLPIDGCPSGYLGPGGLADDGAYPRCTGGAHRVVDVAIFGNAHLDQGPQCQDFYACPVPHDPEGALGALSAAWAAWLGLCAGRILIAQRDASAARGESALGARAYARSVAARWLCATVALCTIAGALCGWKKEGGLLPINKALWSPSFVLLLSGWGSAVLAGLLLLVDAARVWDGAPFRFAGENSLGIYVVSETLNGQVPLKLFWNADKSWHSHAEALVSALSGQAALLSLARCWHLQGWSWAV